MYKIADLLTTMVQKEASDMFITVGTEPIIKVAGKMIPVSGAYLTARESRELCYSIMTEAQRRDFEADKECNFAIHPKKLGRFRVNVFLQQSCVGMVIRYIKSEIPSFEELYLPPVMKKIALHKLGMVIFVGGTGSGKSTSMAALIDYRNTHMSGHIITIEDQIGEIRTQDTMEKAIAFSETGHLCIATLHANDTEFLF